jgi:hypothetical protein
MRIRTIFSLCVSMALIYLASAMPSYAQFKEGGEEKGTKKGKSETTLWRVGAIVKASGGPCLGLAGYVPVPTKWPEQEVRVVEEDVTSTVQIRYEMIDNGARVMHIKIARLAPGQEAKALVTLEIRRSTILPPENTENYVLPDVKKLSPKIRCYLTPSPLIEVRDPKIREAAKQVGVEEKEKAWDKVEAIYDWVRAKIKYENGPIKGAKAALKDGTGDCEELTSLFIAICRVNDIPARTVWVQGHCYPEFYLNDDKGEGHWFPCQAAGAREFGGITELRPILQKGDNFRQLLGKDKEHQRYLAEKLIGTKSRGGGDPQAQFIRETVSK